MDQQEKTILDLGKMVDKISRKFDPERLVNVDEAAKRFGMVRKQFLRFVPVLMAEYGLEQTRMGRCWKFTEKSINKTIRKMAENEAHIPIQKDSN